MWKRMLMKNYRFIDIPMFDIKYLAMQKVLMHAGAISKLVYCFVSVWAILCLLNLPVLTHKPYNYYTYCYMYWNTLFSDSPLVKKEEQYIVLAIAAVNALFCLIIIVKAVNISSV